VKYHHISRSFFAKIFYLIYIFLIQNLTKIYILFDILHLLADVPDFVNFGIFFNKMSE